MKVKLLKKLRQEAKEIFVVIECWGNISVYRKIYYTMDDMYPIVQKGERPRVLWSSLEEVERDLPVFRRRYILGRIRQMRLRKELKIRKQEGNL